MLLIEVEYMSRLIDVDLIVDSDIANCLGVEYCCCLPDVRGMLNDQPTAYDVEKVIEQLNELLEEKTSDSGEDWYTAECLAKAIEIVKQSGVNDFSY